MPLISTHRTDRRAAPLALLFALAACSDEPSGPRATTPVTFCLDATFVAYRNEGAPWRRLQPRDSVRQPLGLVYAVDATERVGIAYTWGSDAKFMVARYMSAAQANAVFRCDDFGTIPPSYRSTAVVRPWNGVGEVQVSYGPGYPYPWIHSGPDSVFQFPTLEAPSDLLAVRGAWTDALRVDRMIVRRAQSYPAGSRIVLDFTAGEAFTLDEQRLRFDGSRTDVEVGFETGTGAPVWVSGGMVGQVGEPSLPRVVTIHTVPESRLQPGDLHLVQLAEPESDAWRRMQYWTRLPRDLVLGLGPEPALPTLRSVATSPYMRITAEVASQPAYDASATIDYIQESTPRRYATVTATREYFGATPATWRLEMPDLGGLAGFPSDAGLRAGPLRWTLATTNRPGFSWVSVGPPHEGQLFRWATAQGVRP